MTEIRTRPSSHEVLSAGTPARRPAPGAATWEHSETCVRPRCYRDVVTIRPFRASRRGRGLALFAAWLACAAWSWGCTLPADALAQTDSSAPAPTLTVASEAAAGDIGQTSASAVKPSAAATLEQCLTAAVQSERSATFGGEMTALAGSARMEMRIEVLERLPGEPLFHSVIAPGLGVWRTAAPGVKVYKYLKQVTNLSAPATYRGAVSFRWLNAKDRLIKELELRTPKCEQPAPAPSTTAAGTPANAA